MAYTKILVIHNRLDKCVSYTQDAEKTSLEATIDYALNREKTEKVCFETAINCDRDHVYQDMMDTKHRWSKEDRPRKGYHIIQSFPPGEVTPDEAHAVAVEFVQRLLADRYEVIVSTHLNKVHLHSHIVFNSVSFMDGKMYRDQFKDYYGESGVGIRGTSDAICREHGLSIIEPAEPLAGPVSRAEWEATRKGNPTIRGLVRQDIDAALSNAYTLRSFWSQLEQLGYTIKRGPNVKYTALRPPGGQRYLRLDSLGEGYTEADIQSRLAALRAGTAPSEHSSEPAPKLISGERYHVRGGIPRYKPRKLRGFRALYFKYLYLLGAIPKRRPNDRAALLSRTEIIKFDRYQEQFRYLMKNRIETADQLAMQYDALQAEIDALTDQRKSLYHQRRAGSCGDTIAEEIEVLTSQLRGLRRELKLCVRIENDISTVRTGVESCPTTKSINRSKVYEKANKSRTDQHSRISPQQSSGADHEH